MQKTAQPAACATPRVAQSTGNSERGLAWSLPTITRLFNFYQNMLLESKRLFDF
jgi:hypothetical protein